MSEAPVLKIQLMLKGRPIKNYTFIKDLVTIGRDPGADIVLDNMGISRHHARIRCGAGGYILEDVGSSNGTFVNGTRVQRHQIHDADRIKVGKFDLHVSVDESSHQTGRFVAKEPELDADGTTVLTTDQLARVLSNQAQPEEAQPALSVVDGAAASQPRPSAVISYAPWILAIIGALLIGLALGATLL